MTDAPDATSPYAKTMSSDSGPGSIRVGALEKPLEAMDYTERYAIVHTLGEGGMGHVLLLRDAQIGRNVAVKIMRRQRADQADSRARFAREARIQGQLEHPAIVPVYDLGVDPRGSLYFTMKRVRGVTLLDILDGLRSGAPGFEARYTRRRLLNAWGSVCLAIDFAHERGVLHRDLKPENIMLGDFGEVYVLDWGVARLCEGDESSREGEVPVAPGDGYATMEGAVLGTPGYMAPEQARAELAVGPQADVYALGAILFEILTLQSLHDLRDPKAAIASTLVGADARASVRAPDRDVAPELEAICVRATALEARDRPARARALHEEVELFLDGQRDVEQRRQAARVHAEAATTAAERAQRREGSLDERREAMRQIGRALALDPDNQEAAAALVRLLTEPPAELPPEVRIAMDRSTSTHRRWMGRVGAITYVSLFLYLPILAWLGVRSWTAFLGIGMPIALAGALSAYQSLRRKPQAGIVLVTMLLSNLGFALGSVFFGPLLVVPIAVATNTTAYAVHLQGWQRRFAVAVGCVTLVVPVVMQALGIVAPSYAFHDGVMEILPNAILLPEGPTLVVLTLAGVVGTLTGSLAVSIVRDALGDAERQLYLYTWHLREFVPGPARPATDPSLGRRLRANLAGRAAR